MDQSPKIHRIYRRIFFTLSQNASTGTAAVMMCEFVLDSDWFEIIIRTIIKLIFNISIATYTRKCGQSILP